MCVSCVCNSILFMGMFLHECRLLYMHVCLCHAYESPHPQSWITRHNLQEQMHPQTCTHMCTQTYAATTREGHTGGTESHTGKRVEEHTHTNHRSTHMCRLFGHHHMRLKPTAYRYMQDSWSHDRECVSRHMLMYTRSCMTDL